MKEYTKLIFEISEPGKLGYRLPPLDVDDLCLDTIFPADFLTAKELDFPEVSEFEVVRHYTNLSMKNYGLDTGFYPLGSCTMKYNPKLNEEMAALDGFQNIHPYQDPSQVQGALQLMYELAESISDIAGMDYTTFQPAAGAHGEITGIMLIKAFHEKNGDFSRNKVIVPDSAHGTNPATAGMAGYKVVEIKSSKEGRVDVNALRAAVGPDTAAIMLTNPNTLGIYEKDILEIAKIVHDAGGLLYYDGANGNAIMGQLRPGDMGFDVVHYNLHKTFSTPHGGGGPGAGLVGVKYFLKSFLPNPIVEKVGDHYELLYNIPFSIGRVKDFHGHFGILVRCFAYILSLGHDGLKKASTIAVLNANYLAKKLRGVYNLPYGTLFKHEFVLAGIKDVPEVTTLDIAKRLLDKGYHPPTIYFPLIVHEAMMIEPTETESKKTLDEFVETMLEIAEEARTNPELLKSAPHDTIVRRPDETKAAKDLVLTYKP